MSLLILPLLGSSSALFSALFSASFSVKLCGNCSGISSLEEPVHTFALYVPLPAGYPGSYFTRNDADPSFPLPCYSFLTLKKSFFLTSLSCGSVSKKASLYFLLSFFAPKTRRIS